MTDQPSKVVPVEVIARLLTIAREADRPNEAEMLEQRIEEAQTPAPQGGGEAELTSASEVLSLMTRDPVICTMRKAGLSDSALITLGYALVADRKDRAALKPQTPDVLGEAREAFFDLIADARKWEEEGDEDGFSYELHFGQHSLLPLMAAFGIECMSFPIEVDGEIFGGMETPAQAIYRASNAPKIATPPGDVLGGEGEAWPTLDQVARVIDPDAWEHVDGCHEAMKGADDTDLKILRSVIDRRLRESGSITTAEQIDALYSAARPSQSDEGEKT